MKADIVIPNLKATSKRQVFEEIASHVSRIYACDETLLLEALLEREKIGSTGIGRGVAVPHVHHADLKCMVGVIARLDTAVDFDAVDEKPVDLVFMLLAPEEAKNNLHLKALARISRFLRDEEACQQLRCSTTMDAVLGVLKDWDADVAA